MPLPLAFCFPLSAASFETASGEEGWRRRRRGGLSRRSRCDANANWHWETAMNAKATRILKEARPLFWPWCAVVIAGVLPLVHPLHSMRWISLIGFYLGIPLLATLPLGNEFQHRTLSLLLSQPVRRMEIWGEKLSVTVVAVLSAVLVFAIAWRGR